MYKLERACVKSRFPRSGAPIALVDGFLHDNGSFQVLETFAQGGKYLW